jgi:FkbM family methyltransferase
MESRLQLSSPKKSRFRDAISILLSSKRPIVFGIYCINMILYALRTRTRIFRIPLTRFTRNGLAYYANSWDGLLVLRPGHEPQVNAAVKAVANRAQGGTFVNVGAHIGRYCIEFAHHFDKVVAYEPTPETFSLLSKAVEKHPLRDRIVIREACVAQRAGTVMLQLLHVESQNTITVAHDARSIGSIEVPMVSLDEDLSEDEKRSLRLLLVDVEGAEYLVLQGARDTLRVGNPVIIAEFLSEERRQPCDGLLNDFGYRGRPIDRTNWRYERASKV